MIAASKADERIAHAEAGAPANANADDDATVLMKKVRTTMEEQAASGHAVYTQLEVHIYVKIAYFDRYSEPPENEWGDIAPTLSSKRGVRPAIILAVFKKGQSGKPNPEK